MIIRNLLILFSLAFSFLAVAQENTPPKVQLVLPKDAVMGSTVRATVMITFEAGLHGYQNPPTKDYMIPVKLSSATKGVTLKPAYPRGTVMDIAGEQAAVYEGTISVPVVLTLPKKPGAVDIKIELAYQQCTHQACFPPSTVLASGKIVVKKKAS